MIQHLILRRLTTEEHKLGMSLDYLRHLVRVSLPAFLKFSLFLPISRHRNALPPAPYHGARIIAARAADCGTCVQAEVNLARQAGVAPAIIAAVIDQRDEDLAPDLADVCRFTQAVLDASGEEETLRPRLLAHYGETGMAELALAIATAQVYPVTKRALGYATSCARITIQMDAATPSSTGDQRAPVD